MEPVLLNNRYRLSEMVGAGGMAVVYRGLDTLLNRQVAVKVLREGYAGDPAFLARFRREAQAAANLDHPNIVTVYDVGQQGDRHYIVMEYVDGLDLKSLVRQSGRLTVDQALNIAVQIAAGVGHAHRKGVIHCDIKPHNVLVTHDGRAKVTDFGIARALSELGLTEAETVWGSPIYFAPEQAIGDPPTPASDVYSLGVVMYEMLAGHPPFHAEKATALALMHMRDEPEPISAHNQQVPPRLEWIVHKVLAKEPSARYRNAEQLAYVLEEYRQQGEQSTGWRGTSAAVEDQEPLPDELGDTNQNPLVDRSARQEELGTLSWVLSLIAAIAVLGLIPLWGLVYRAYTAPAGPPPTATVSPLATFTPEAERVTVPRVEDRPIAEAQRLLEEVGLQVIIEERRDPDAEPGQVLDQDPAPGRTIARDRPVVLFVSSEQRKLVMPGVVGYPLEMAQNGLEGDGLSVVIQETWSTLQKGTIVEQAPPRGTTIFAGDIVTLTVSGGPDVPIPLEANLADRFLLHSAEIHQTSFQPGDALGVTLRWRPLRATDQHYVVFVHLVDPTGDVVSQQDREPVIPTTEWVSGVDVVDAYQVGIPEGSASGRYQLRVGLYLRGQPGSRVQVVDPGRTIVDSNSILITELSVQ